MPYSNEEISEIIQEFMQAVGTRQYIGSRYIPIFGRRGEDSIIWDNTGTYEPLTIVLYQGNSYTSRQFVPVGVDILNEEFWANTGNYNAQVEQYRQTVLAYDGRITANADAITAETSAREDAITQVSADIAAETSAREDAITQVSADIAAEVSARESAITQISADIAAETSARESAITQVSADIATETSAREDADADLGERIDAEIAARTDADSGINARIDNVNTAIAILNDSISPANLGSVIAPVYVGDFMEARQFGACCRVGDVMYTISPDNYENTGVVRGFNLVSNTKTFERSIQMGHGNSMAYDSVRERFWIAPINFYSGGTATPANVVYYYDTTFADMNTMQMPDPILFVSFDPVTNIMYCGRFENDLTMKVYRMLPSESAFTLYRTIPGSNFSYVNDTSLWQDCAIYNNVAHVIKPEGTMYVINLLDDSPTVDYTYRVLSEDANGYWCYGEVEGIEFDSNGNLYNARNGDTGIMIPNAHHNVNCSFVTELNTRNKACPAWHYTQTPFGSLDLTTAAQGRFRLNRSEIRSLTQLQWIRTPFATVNIPENNTITDPYRIRITCRNPICIAVNGSYTCQRIEFDGGMLGIYINTNGVLTFTDASNSPIYLYDGRVSDIHFRNRGRVVYSNDSFLRFGYGNCNVSILEMSNPSTMKFGNTNVLSAPCMLVGYQKIYGGN